MLRERIVCFLSEIQHLNHWQQHLLVRALLLYGLGRRNSSELRELARQFNVTDPLYKLKSQFFDRTYYMISIYWRVTFEYFRQLPCVSHLTCTALDPMVLEKAVTSVSTVGSSMRQACRGDVGLIESFLNLDDHNELYRLARALPYSTPNECDLLPVIKKLQRYCASLAYKRMRFLVEHDRALTFDDLKTELFEAGLMTLRHYDADFHDGLKLLNTAKKGARNYFVRLVEFHTAQCRSRLVRHMDQDIVRYRMRRCGTCGWFDTKDSDGMSCQDRGMYSSYQPCLARWRGNFYHARSITVAEECGNCIHYDENGGLACVARNVAPTAQPCKNFELRTSCEHFVDTTASLDAPVGMEDRRERGTLLDLIPAPLIDGGRDAWLTELLEQLPASSARVVRITLGMGDAEFDDWLWYETGQQSCQFADGAIARYACIFVGVTIEMVRDHLRQFLTIPRRARSERA